MNKLFLSEFIRYNTFDDVLFEGYEEPYKPIELADPNIKPTNPEEVGTADDMRLRAREQDTQAKIGLQQQQQTAEPAKQALVDFITNQLPNVRLDPARMSLEDIVIRGGGNLATTLADPRMADFARQLGMSVRGWLSTLKGPIQKEMSALLQPFGNNINHLVKAVAPDVSAKLQQTHAKLK